MWLSAPISIYCFRKHSVAQPPNRAYFRSHFRRPKTRSTVKSITVNPGTAQAVDLKLSASQ
jgi:hypothetical protein